MQVIDEPIIPAEAMNWVKCPTLSTVRATVPAFPRQAEPIGETAGGLAFGAGAQQSTLSVVFTGLAGLFCRPSRSSIGVQRVGRRTQIQGRVSVSTAWRIVSRAACASSIGIIPMEITPDAVDSWTRPNPRRRSKID